MGYNKLTRTPYGQVRKVVLEQLQQSFDTRELLATVDEIDRFCAQWTEELRSDLLRLHGMAHCVINDAPPNTTSQQGNLGRDGGFAEFGV
jgi:hypothetical protein